ncbi:MAG: hypothetical protein ACO1OT_07835, partial [Heyndrickxia sp.]
RFLSSFSLSVSRFLRLLPTIRQHRVKFEVPFSMARELTRRVSYISVKDSEGEITLQISLIHTPMSKALALFL